MTAFSRECLESLDRCLAEGDYQQVRGRRCTCTRLPAPPTPLCVPLPQVLALSAACLQKQQALLAETHLCRLRVLDAAAEALSRLRRFPEAAAHTGALLRGYR